MGYYILHNPEAPSGTGDLALASELETLRTRLEHGSTAQRRQVILRLVALRAERPLAQCLASEQPEVVQLATAGLWECWLGEEGPEARRRIDEGVNLMNAGDLDSAEHVFLDLMADHPGWAEAINKQATVLYLRGKPQDSVVFCRRVVALKPDHFGAWNGLAICAIQLEDWATAHQAVRESLRLQPHSRMNQQLLRLVETRLPQA